LIPPIPAVPPSPPVPAVSESQPQTTTSPTTGFSSLLGSAVDNLSSTETAATKASLGVAAGTESLSDYMVQATSAEMSAELTVAVRNAAMTSLNQILDM